MSSSSRIVVDFLASLQQFAADIWCSIQWEAELIEKISPGIFQASLLFWNKLLRPLSVKIMPFFTPPTQMLQPIEINRRFRSRSSTRQRSDEMICRFLSAKSKESHRKFNRLAKIDVEVLAARRCVMIIKLTDSNSTSTSLFPFSFCGEMWRNFSIHPMLGQDSKKKTLNLWQFSLSSFVIHLNEAVQNANDVKNGISLFHSPTHPRTDEGAAAEKRGYSNDCANVKSTASADAVAMLRVSERWKNFFFLSPFLSFSRTYWNRLKFPATQLLSAIMMKMFGKFLPLSVCRVSLAAEGSLSEIGKYPLRSVQIRSCSLSRSASSALELKLLVWIV